MATTSIPTSTIPPSTAPALRWLYLAGAALGVLAAGVAGAALSPALPSLYRTLHLGDLGDLRWITATYTVTFVVLIAPAAVLGALVGPARVLLLGGFVLAVASVIGAVASGAGGLVIARLGQGAGAALIVPQIVAYARWRLQGLERAIACALFAFAYLTGTVLGSVLGGLLTEHVTWRATFWIVVPLALIAAGTSIPVVLEPGFGRFELLPLIAGIVAMPAAFCIMLPLVANNGEWSAVWVSVLVFGCVLLAGCIALEVVRRRVPAGLGAPLLTLLAFAAGADLTVMQLYLQVAEGASPLSAGLSVLPLAAGALIGAGVAVPLGIQLGMRAANAGGVALMFLGVVIQYVVLQAAPDSFGWGPVALGAVFNGLGLGLVLATLMRSDGDAARPPADPVPVALFAAIPIGTAVGVEIGLQIASDVADLVVGSQPEYADLMRDHVGTTLIVTLVMLVAALGVALFVGPRGQYRPSSEIIG